MAREQVGGSRTLGGNASVDTVDAAVTPSAEASVRLPGAARSVPAARRFIDATLRGWGRGDLAHVVRLLASEVVTNAIMHARSEFQLRVLLRGERLRVEVHDASRHLPVWRRVRPDSETGHGLVIVDSLSGSWGVDADRSGKTVWFELAAATF